MVRLPGIGLVAALAAVASLWLSLPSAEAAKLKSKSKAPSPIASFSELAGINSEVELVQDQAAQAEKSKALIRDPELLERAPMLNQHC